MGRALSVPSHPQRKRQRRRSRALLPAGRFRTHPRGHAREGARSRRQPRQRGNGDRGRLPNANPTCAPHPNRSRCPGEVPLPQHRQRCEGSRGAGASRAPKPRAGHKPHKSPPPGHVTVPGAAAKFTQARKPFVIGQGSAEQPRPPPGTREPNAAPTGSGAPPQPQIPAAFTCGPLHEQPCCGSQRRGTGAAPCPRWSPPHTGHAATGKSLG